MRDRLIELINNYPCMSTAEDCFIESISSDLADYLLANGVIVPPCKNGDTIWYELYGEIKSAVVYTCVGNLGGQGFIITDAYAKSSDGLEVAFNGKCFGKSIFLTREEAEAALKGGVKE